MTKIEWASEVWNSVTGCSPISEGCQNCYAHKMAQRLKGRFGYPQNEPFRVTFHPDKLEQPLRWKKPRRIFVCSMGDLFHKDIPFDVIAAAFGVMSFCQQHTFIVLTKRPSRMVKFFDGFHNGDYRSNFNWWLNEACSALPDNITKGIRLRPKPDKLPLPNVYLGVSVESDKYRWRIEELIKIPGKHLVSYEPALGPLDLCVPYGQGVGDLLIDNIDGVIAGCESGPGRRPAKMQWFRGLKNQCVDANVPFFLKQMDESMDKKAPIIKMPFLDGKIWNELPF